MFFQYINIRQVPREMLKTAASGLGFQHLPRDLANVNARKTMYNPYNVYFLCIYATSKTTNDNEAVFCVQGSIPWVTAWN